MVSFNLVSDLSSDPRRHPYFGMPYESGLRYGHQLLYSFYSSRLLDTDLLKICALVRNSEMHSLSILQSTCGVAFQSITTGRLPCRVLLSIATSGRNKSCRRQQMPCKCGVIKYTTNLVPTGVRHLGSWDPKDPSTSWLENRNYRIAGCEHRQTSGHFRPIQNQLK